MPKPRSMQISLEITPFYHIVSRCVRQSYLCGIDTLQNKSYEHRRKWVEDRLLKLSRCFAIDICSYAVMSNHTHLILKINKQKAERWNTREVIERWLVAYPGNKLCKAVISGKKLTPTQQTKLTESIEKWREQLYSISWFMRNLNHHIACAANKEDGCTGHFWEGRFKSQALLGRQALLSSMVYVDLNPIRAGLADKPEISGHTSIKKRIECAKHPTRPYQPEELLPFVDNNTRKDGLEFKLKEYLELVDSTGRRMRKKQTGSIPSELPPILERLYINSEQWEKLTQGFESQFKYFAGPANQVKTACIQMGYKRVRGLNACEALFSA